MNFLLIALRLSLPAVVGIILLLIVFLFLLTKRLVLLLLVLLLFPACLLLLVFLLLGLIVRLFDRHAEMFAFADIGTGIIAIVGGFKPILEDLARIEGFPFLVPE